MSNITRFIPKAERIKSALADEARQGVLALGLPELATEDILSLFSVTKQGAHWQTGLST